MLFRKETMKEKWVVTAKGADFKKIAERFLIHPVLARLIVNRDVKDLEDIRKYLQGSTQDMYSPKSMKNILKASQIIEACVTRGEKIAIASDFDVDGVMAAFVLKKGLERIGARCYIYTPDRVSEGYGLNNRIVDEAYAAGASLIVTCDNGIAAFDAIDHAKALGMKVVVTDHHDIPFEELEDGTTRILTVAADAIVNPKQSDCNYPFKKLCGAGVAYKLICMLYDRYSIKDEEKHELLEYVAIATVADVMDLCDENRIIVKEGLKRVKHTTNPGLKALIQVNQLNIERLSAYHIGFVIGPCFNAAGRLDSAKMALDLLEESDETNAYVMASQLKELNESRKSLTVKGFEQAVEKIENSELKQDKVLVVLLEDCHESLVGIIAGRIKEKYHKPTIVFSRVEDGLVKGSGRSIESYNMFIQLSKQKHLMERFGGHPMAAGMTLQEEHLDILRTNLNATATLTEEDFIPVVRIDVPLPIGYVTKDFIKQLELLEPFGKGNTKPVFAEKFFKLLKARIIGKNKNVLKLTVMDDQHCTMDAVYFGDVEDFEKFVEDEYGSIEKNLLFAGKKNSIEMAMTYYPEINTYMGVESVQLVITGYCHIRR